MAEPENHTLDYLRKMDRELREFRNKVGNKVEGDLQDIRDKVDRNYEIHQRRLNALQLAMQGKDFSYDCAFARVDARISALEKRSSRPRKPK